MGTLNVQVNILLYTALLITTTVAKRHMPIRTLHRIHTSLFVFLISFLYVIDIAAIVFSVVREYCSWEYLQNLYQLASICRHAHIRNSSNGKAGPLGAGRSH